MSLRSTVIQSSSRFLRNSALTRNSANLERYAAIRAFFHQERRNQTDAFSKQQTVAVKNASISRLRSSNGFQIGIRLYHYSAIWRNASTPPQHVPSTPERKDHSKNPSPTDASRQNGEDGPVPQSTFPSPNLDNYSQFFRRLALSLPHLQTPTRDDFLNVTTGFWKRTRIRFKWFTIKSFRKFNADDISAFVTWFLMSQTLWILVGTTTFFSVVFATVNSLSLQESVARALSDYLTSETGVNIIFESAIVPKWKDSRISFKNVYISRRPPSEIAKVVKQSASERRNRAGYLAAVGYDVGNHPAYHHVEEDEAEDSGLNSQGKEDTNFAMLDLNVDSIDVTLSLWKWLDGKGLVVDATVKGVRGVLDRRSVQYDPKTPLDPAAFRHTSRPGDFELESLQLEDVLITVYQPGDFRPYTASIFQADLRLFRKQWLFYDLLSAENIVGQFDNCLFSLHRPQSIGRSTEMDLQDGHWARMSRIRIDGVNIDHIKGTSTSAENPISWIMSGKVDAVLDIKFPRDPNSTLAFNDILGEIADAISITLAPDPSLKRIPGQRELAKPPLTAPDLLDSGKDNPVGVTRPQEQKKVIIDIDLRLRDLKAAVPLFPGDLSYVNSALIRPIVAFMNANRTLVPIHCRVVKNLEEFEGAWTMWESGLMNEISMKTYEALAYHVTQANMNRQRMKTVGIWSLQLTANAVLSTLRNVVSPVSNQLRESYLSTMGLGVDSLNDTL